MRCRLWTLLTLGFALGLCPAPLPAHDAQAAAAQGTATAAVLDVGQGDSILIRSPEGRTALIDAEPAGLDVEDLGRLERTTEAYGIEA